MVADLSAVDTRGHPRVSYSPAAPLFPRAAPGTSFPDDSPSANDDELRMCTD